MLHRDTMKQLPISLQEAIVSLHYHHTKVLQTSREIIELLPELPEGLWAAVVWELGDSMDIDFSGGELSTEEGPPGNLYRVLAKLFEETPEDLLLNDPDRGECLEFDDLEAYAEYLGYNDWVIIEMEDQAPDRHRFAWSKNPNPEIVADTWEGETERDTLMEAQAVSLIRCRNPEELRCPDCLDSDPEQCPKCDGVGYYVAP